MAKDTKIGNASAQDALNAVTARVNNGTVKIYTTPIPTDVDVPATGTLLSTHTYSATAYQPATDANPGAIATANSIGSATAAATGTAAYFRGDNSGGTSQHQGTVGTADADLIVNSVNFQSGANVDITSATMTMPESS